MNFSTWNVQGLSKKINEVTKELEILNIDIAVLTETKKKGQGSENLGHYDHFYSGIPKDKRAQKGVSILIAKKLRKYIKTWEAISERLITMNLSLHDHKITIIGIYAVNDDELVKNKDEFFEQLHNEITKIGNSREIIILGDLNSRTGKKQQDDVVGEYGEDTTNDNGKRLIALCEQNDLQITNGFFQHHWIHKYTWTQSTRNLKSIIDYMIVKQKRDMKIHDVRVHRGATCGSDHHLLKSKILFPRKKGNAQHENDKKEKIEVSRYNLNSLEQESVKFLFKKRLDEKLESINFSNTEEHYQQIKICLHAAAQEALGYYEKNKRSHPYWWDEEVEKQIEEKREKYQKYLSSKKDTDKIIYKEAQAKTRRKIIQKKNEAWEKNCNRINTYLGGTRSSESWKLLKSLRQENKKEITLPITLQNLDKYFSELLTEDRTEFQENLETQTVQTVASPIRINTQEVKHVCRSLKNGKSAGPGDIPAELIKCGTDKLYENLKKLFQNCLNNEETPQEWRTSLITAIHKKGPKDKPENYRGIAVTSTISRIYGKVLKAKIEQEYSDMEAEEQAGFRAGRSTVDHLFCISQLIEKKLAYNQELHLLYVDLKKAYDSIPHTKLWEALQKTNINVGLIKAVKSLYKNTTAKIRQGNAVSTGFTVNKGLKQGCCLSPTLFKIYLEQVLKMWKRKCGSMGIPLNEKTLYTLCFADDQIIIAQDYEDLEYMTRKLIEEYKQGGLEVNLKKTEYMCIGGQKKDLILEDGYHIKYCENYKYLGLKITDDGTLDEAIKERNTQGRKAIAIMNSILWDQNISKTNKQRIYNTIVKSIITYSSEVWQLKKTTKKKLEATEMDFWRRAAGKSRIERTTNKRIREIMGVTHTITEEIKTKQLRWYGHVQRMNDDRLPKQIIKWKPQGRRKRGRPRLSWREGIDTECRERGLEEDLWMDRERWRLEIGRRRRTL